MWRLALALVVPLIIVPSISQAQCTWTGGGFVRAGFSGGPADAVVSHDDGSGPGLYVGGAFNRVGGVDCNGIARWDGSSWTALGSGASGGSVFSSINAMASLDLGGGPDLYVGGDFLFMDGVPASYIARWDGTMWSGLGAGFDGPVFDMAVYDDGTGPALYVAGVGLGFGAVGRWNGTSWTTIAVTTLGPPTTLEVYDAGSGPELYVGGNFSTIGPPGGPALTAQDLARWNGASWATVGPSGSGVGTLGLTYALDLEVYDGGGGPELYVCGPFGAPTGAVGQGIIRWNGSTWAALGSGVAGLPLTLETFDDGSGPVLVVGGDFGGAGGIASRSVVAWDGTSWSALGTALGNPAGFAALAVLVQDLAVFDDGSGPVLVPVGQFWTAGPHNVRSIARWDGTIWSILGTDTGLQLDPFTLLSWGSGSGPELYAGGRFIYAAGRVVNGIARWDGTTWNSLAGGVTAMFATSEVRDMVIFDDGSGPALFVTGDFSAAGGAFGFGGIGKWDGTTWTPLGGGFGGSFPVGRTLAVYDDGTGPALYAGGFFNTAGGVLVANVARWDGITWIPLGSGMGFSAVGTSAVLTLEVFDDGTGPRLYAGGIFDTAGGVPANHIAAWDGATWVPLGPGVAGGPSTRVSALKTYDDGVRPRLFIGGDFFMVGGMPVAGIASWDGTAISAVGTGGGVSETLTLEVADDGTGPALFVGGTFAMAGGVPAANLVRWDGSAWSALGTGTYGTVRALATHDDGTGIDLYVGGPTSAGGVPADGLAVWRCGASLSLEMNQAGGAGGPVHVQVSNLTAGRVYHTVYSADPCPTGLGTGPFLGLCTTNVTALVNQYLLPLGLEPFHFLGSGPTALFGPYFGLGPMTVEGVLFDTTGGVLGRVSPVVSLTIM